MHTTLPLRRILACIDFTDSSRRAFYAALDLAAKYGAETHVLHVAEPIRSFDMAKARYVETTAALERLESGVKRRVDELWREGGVQVVDRRRVHVIVRGGRAESQIIKTAQDEGVDLIVLGAGAGIHAGSTATNVTNHAPCTVLCVRPDATA